MSLPPPRQGIRRSDEHAEMPEAVRYVAAVLPFATAVVVLWQRHAISSPGRTTLFVGIAVLPWLLQAAGVTLWRPVFTVLVLGGTLGMLLRPVDIDIAPFFLVFLAAEMGTIAPTRESILWTLAAMGVMAGVDLWGPYDQSLPWYFGIALGWGGGFMIRFQLQLLAQLRATQTDLAERAATDERRRIARDLHDVIAHSLTVMMLHVTGARRALERDTKDSAAALEEAERLGRQSLQDVRRVVGVL